MSLVRFTPFETLDTVREQLLRNFEEPSDTCFSSGNFYLPIELTEDDTNFYVRSIVPGVKTEHISLETEDGILTISCEMNRRELKENEKMHLSDFCYGKFKRSIKMGKNIDPESITADYKQGILNITIPKSAKSLKKTITIQEAE
jgi:HSP20 family protein